MGHNSSFGKLKKIKRNHFKHIFDKDAVRLGMNYTEKKNYKNMNAKRINNTFLNNQEVTKESKEEIKDT